MLLLGGCNDGPPAGRYVVVFAAERQPILTDSATGTSWVLRFDEKGDPFWHPIKR